MFVCARVRARACVCMCVCVYKYKIIYYLLSVLYIKTYQMKMLQINMIYSVYIVVDQVVFDEDHNNDTYEVYKDELALKAA